MTRGNNNNDELLVSIRCTVFNHEKFLRQCLDGFVMQQTNFLFEAVVHDDASTDNSAAIIREYAEKYPDIIKPIYETENQYSKHDGSFQRIMNNACRGKYIAFCEGDDYWTDPLKIQKQVDYLESHPEYEAVHTAFRFYYQNNDIFKERHRNLYQDQKKLVFDIVASYTDIQTCTLMCNGDIYRTLTSEKKEGLFTIEGNYTAYDIQFCSAFAWYHGIGYIDDVTAVYRIHGDSVSARSDVNKQIFYKQRMSNIRLHMAEFFDIPQSYKTYIKKRSGFEIAVLQLYDGQYKSAKETAKSLHNAKLSFLIYLFQLLHIKNQRMIQKAISVLNIKNELLNS